MISSKDSEPAAADGQNWRQKFVSWAPSIATNALAGVVASLLTIAYCLSFSALLFQGELGGGMPAGLWGLLMGSAIAGLYVSLKTSLPPAEAGPDNPAVAVLSVLAATVSGTVVSAGGSPAMAVDYVLLSFSLATLVTGAVLFAIGAGKVGRVIRFIPYPVIAGFLGASGWFLVTGGLEVLTGRDLSLASLATVLPADRIPQVLTGVSFALLVYGLKRWTGSTYVLPIAFLGGSGLIDLALSAAGARSADGWYIGGSAELAPWVPLAAFIREPIDVLPFLRAAPEIAAVATVTVVALMLDITGLEVSRTKTADLDHEFRINGAANMLAAPLGGIMGNLSLNGSRLLDEAGGLARASGVFASLVIVLIVGTGLDLTRYVPAPILAGLLMYLGLTVLIEVMLRSPAHGAWTDRALALLILGAIVYSGYLTGVVFGTIAACLMFAVNYSRVAVIRRHLTRATIASNMERSPEATRRLETSADQIHIFWLSGFIFFGSSNAVFERISRVLGATHANRRYVILDASDVSGFDTSAVLSIVKLRNACDGAGTTLVIASLAPPHFAAFERAGIVNDGGPHRMFAALAQALEWCEDEVLADWGDAPQEATDFEPWLAAEVDDAGVARRLLSYFNRRLVGRGEVLYLERSPADTIDFVVGGTVSVEVVRDDGSRHVIRRMSRKTVLGEMGFFRASVRTASVFAEEPVTIYTISRRDYERLVAEDPAAAAHFLQYIVRVLSDRLEFANRGVAALT